MTDVCNLMSRGVLWSPIYKINNQIWPPTQLRLISKNDLLIIGTAPIDISNYSLVLLEMKSITNSARLGGPKSGNLDDEMIL